jgi:hypothetical protein
MDKNRIKQIVAEEVKRQRKRLFQEQGDPLAPSAPQPQQPATPAPQPTNAAPALNPKKATGIIAGAIKTLMNSGALQGVGPEQVQQLTQDMIQNLNTSVGGSPEAVPTAPTTPAAPMPDASEQDDTEFADDVVNKKQEDEFDDQNQYDPDLDKQVTPAAGEEEEVPAEEDPFGEEPLFEVKDLRAIFKLNEAETANPTMAFTVTKLLRGLAIHVPDDNTKDKILRILNNYPSQERVKSIIQVLDRELSKVPNLDPRYKKLMTVISNRVKDGRLYENWIK